MSRRTRYWFAALLGVAVATGPTTAFADPPKPTDWRSEVVDVRPPTDVVVASVEGGDAFLRIEVESGHDVIVEGYGGEPYLWIDTEGVVHENRRSPATYLNQSMTGDAALPADADPDASPEWTVIGDGGAWSWHDHRAHYMGGEPPADMQPGESLPETRVPITVDGVATEIIVRTTLVASPSAWPAVMGALLGLGLVALMLLPGKRISAAVAILPIAVAASWLGIVQYLSLPGETGPRLVWWVPPVIAVICGVALTVVRRSAIFARAALALVAASQLVLWGFARREGIAHAVLPTPAPFWLDRLVTAAALAAGTALVAVTVFELVRAIGPNRPDPVQAAVSAD